MAKKRASAPLDQEWGEFLAERKGLLVLIIAGLIAAPLGLGAFKHYQGKRQAAAAEALYRFEQSFFSKYQEEKISATEFAAELDKLCQDIGGQQGLYGQLVRYIDEMMRQSHFDEAEEKLLWGLAGVKNPYVKFLLRLRLVTLYEDSARPELAIATLSEMTKARVRPMEDKLYLDLGRLQLARQRPQKAKKSFEYILEHSQDGEFLKLARLYMEKIQ